MSLAAYSWMMKSMRAISTGQGDPEDEDFKPRFIVFSKFVTTTTLRKPVMEQLTWLVRAVNGQEFRGMYASDVTETTSESFTLVTALAATPAA